MLVFFLVPIQFHHRRIAAGNGLGILAVENILAGEDKQSGFIDKVDGIGKRFNSG
ncbi:hypothetical protein DSCA_42280 [Desulfosarcina alkanivorans]|jgi:hypothetical protein|uniref:Uncharacterized protein n=1 Tax=Desulfosarcina alkanivorans TaxID=571177 RepID=A0A5K7YNB1_9BACT|nr:hypothetical protein DSCA_42280 [Desulfosarcina alkanivorans]